MRVCSSPRSAVDHPSSADSTVPPATPRRPRMAATSGTRGMGWGLGVGPPPGGGAGGSDAPYDGPGPGRWARGAWERRTSGLGGREGRSAAARRSNSGAHCVWSAGGTGVPADTSRLPLPAAARPAVRPPPSVVRRCGADAAVAATSPKPVAKTLTFSNTQPSADQPHTTHRHANPPATAAAAVDGPSRVTPPACPPPHRASQRSVLACNGRGAGADGEESERATPPGSAGTDAGLDRPAAAAAVPARFLLGREEERNAVRAVPAASPCTPPCAPVLFLGRR